MIKYKRIGRAREVKLINYLFMTEESGGSYSDREISRSQTGEGIGKLMY